MWGWFSPKCPLDTWEKTWTETRMRWLAEQFGIERMLRAKVILPTDEFFPEAYGGTPDDARRILEQLRIFMGVARKIRLEIVPDEELPGAAGEYVSGERPLIRVAESQLEEPVRLFATLTHELAHELLLGENRLTAETEDHEQITDLLLVYLGVGLFAANSTVYEKSIREGRYYSWTVGKQGYLPARTFGYAMALFDYVRNEKTSAWASHLRLDASTVLRQGLRYLRRTGDSVFHPDAIQRKREPSSDRDLRLQLQTGSPTVRMAALWDLQPRALADPDLAAAVVQLLDDADIDLPGEAARVLGSLDTPNTSATSTLVRALHSPNERTRIEAAKALGAPQLRSSAAISDLGELLDDPINDVIQTAAQALTQYGPEAMPVVPKLLSSFARALKACKESSIETLADALLAVSAEPEDTTRRFFSNDEELKSQALDVLRERRQVAGQTVE